MRATVHEVIINGSDGTDRAGVCVHVSDPVICDEDLWISVARRLALIDEKLFCFMLICPRS